VQPGTERYLGFGEPGREGVTHDQVAQQQPVVELVEPVDRLITRQTPDLHA
jgi:hypothetical protein